MSITGKSWEKRNIGQRSSDCCWQRSTDQSWTNIPILNFVCYSLLTPTKFTLAFHGTFDGPDQKLKCIENRGYVNLSLIGTPTHTAGMLGVKGLNSKPSWTFTLQRFKYIGGILRTLPKAQRTRGLSSYYKFSHKSWSNFILIFSTKHQLQNLNHT